MDNRKNVLFVYNPKAGKAKIKEHLSDILNIFAAADYRVTIHPTQYPREATEIVSRIREREYDCVVCSGGDGTLDEVVSGMIDSTVNIPIGYIPAGSTNDFATSLGIPSVMTEAAEEIVEGTPFSCDAGKLNGQVFVYIAAFGLFTELSYETEQHLKNIFGHMAYILQGIKNISKIKSYKMTFEAENEKHDGDFIYGMITNSTSVGGFKNVTGKNIQFNDGEFEVTLIRKPQTPAQLNNIIKAFVTQSFEDKNVIHFKTDNLRITSVNPVKWTLDGEYGGEWETVEINNHQKAFSIICKR